MTCVLCRRQSDGYACGHCTDRLADDLIQIQREVELLAAVPSMQQSNGTRGGRLASERSPARLDVIALRDPRTKLGEDSTMGVLHTLLGWTRAIREDRALDWPSRVSVASERRLLSTHLDWAARQPWIDDLAADLRNLLAQLQRANGTGPEPPAGRCYLPDANSNAHPEPNGRARITGTCDGPIWLDTANGHAHCGRCRSTWDGPRLAHLAWELDRAKLEAARPHTPDGRPMLTAAELVQTGHVTSISNVRVRAHRAGIRATNGHYDPALFAPIPA